jgi:heat shock protein HslJ
VASLVHMPSSHHLRRLCALAVVALAAVTACGDDDDDAAVAAADLDGKTFIATETEGHTIVEGSTVSIIFADGNLSVAAGCNTLNGEYTIEDGVLSTGELAATLMACDADLTAQQDWLNDLITSDPEVELDGDQLVLSSGSDSITLEAA